MSTEVAAKHRARALRHAGGMMPTRVLLNQLRQGWRLFFAVELGMLAVVVLVCVTPLYLNLGFDGQLQAALEQAPAQVNIETQLSTVAIAKGIVTQLDAQVTPALTTLSAFAPQSSSLVDASGLAVRAINQARPPRGAAIAQARIEMLAFDLTQAQPHMKLLQGAWPGASDQTSTTPADALATEQSGLKVGDVVLLADPEHPDQMAHVRISGLWFPKSESDPYWNGRSFRSPEYNQDKSPPPIYPLVLTRDGFFQALEGLQLSSGMTVEYISYTQASALKPDNLRAIAADITRYRTLVGARTSGARLAILTRLDTLIQAILRQYTLFRQPLYIVVAQFAGLALLFVLMITTTLVETQGPDLAVLRSRGASRGQLLLTFGIIGALLAVIAVAVGVFLGAGLAILLVRLFFPGGSALFQALSTAQLTQLASPGLALRPAVLAGIGGMAALGVGALLALGRDVRAYEQEQARQVRLPLWRRYHLDLALVALCLAGYVELGQFGGLDIRQQLLQAGGGPSPLLLATPALLIVAGALLLLRVFPLAVRGCLRLAGRTRGVTSLLSFAQVERAGGPFLRLTLLLTLAVGAGLFALTYHTSLGHNAFDRAAYQAGADERVAVLPQFEGSATLRTLPPKFQNLSGVTAMSGVIRTSVNTTVGQGHLQVQELGVDPASFAQVAYWRSDYADQSLTTLLAAMSRHAQGSAAGARDHPIWSLVSASFASNFSLSVGDGYALLPSLSADPSQAEFFVVGAIVSAFPTIYDAGYSGYVIANSADLIAAANTYSPDSPPLNGPNEFWLRTSADPGAATARVSELAASDLFVESSVDRRALESGFREDALSAGMSGVLYAGAVTAALLAILGSLTQAQSLARRRTVQFAVLRTLGAGRGELANILLGEQTVVYVFGLVTGTLLGVALSTASLPYMEYGSTLSDPGALGVPSPTLALNIAGMALFYVALFLALALSLGLSWLAARRAHLDRALRLDDL